MSKRPEVIAINHHAFGVVWGPIDTDDGRFHYGQMSPRWALIRIDDNVAPSQQRDTILHEVIHAVLSDASLDLDDEEKIVRAITPGLLGALRHSEHLVDFLLEEDTWD